jgi:Phosphopantothenoylcysteine synthetase/decarboxylase
MKNIILGVTGSIAAYKAAEIANTLTKKGHNVEVILTKGGLAFITPLTFQTLTHNRVYRDMFEEYVISDVRHISLATKADLLLIAPATADVIGKIASGIADDMLTTVTMACRGIPKLIAPAMNTNMYENPIVQKNMETLKHFGYQILEPRSALLACGTTGTGALAEVESIVKTVEEQLNETKND